MMFGYWPYNPLIRNKVFVLKGNAKLPEFLYTSLIRKILGTNKIHLKMSEGENSLSGKFLEKYGCSNAAN